MLQWIQREKIQVTDVLEKAKSKNESFRLMGVGHRVYKTYDPRAAIIRNICMKKLVKNKNLDPLLEIALELEERILRDDYFVERRLYPNVDFYSGLVYRLLGIPTNMFTVMFAIGRMPGWIAQWKEMRDDKSKIGRPRQLYIGSEEAHYIPMEDRHI